MFDLHLVDDYAATGTMQDMIKKRDVEDGMKSSKGGLFDTQRAYDSHGASSSGINFDNPAVKRALSDLLGSRPYNIQSGSSSRMY